jgi:hypothetical protein
MKYLIIASLLFGACKAQSPPIHQTIHFTHRQVFEDTADNNMYVFTGEKDVDVDVKIDTIHNIIRSNDQVEFVIMDRCINEKGWQIYSCVEVQHGFDCTVQVWKENNKDKFSIAGYGVIILYNN